MDASPASTDALPALLSHKGTLPSRNITCWGADAAFSIHNPRRIKPLRPPEAAPQPCHGLVTPEYETSPKGEAQTPGSSAGRVPGKVGTRRALTPSRSKATAEHSSISQTLVQPRCFWFLSALQLTAGEADLAPTQLAPLPFAFCSKATTPQASGQMSAVTAANTPLKEKLAPQQGKRRLSTGPAMRPPHAAPKQHSGLKHLSQRCKGRA